MYDRISRGTVRRWLRDYDSLVTGCPPEDAIPRNSGSKPTDGISNRQLTKIMIDQALAALPKDLKGAAFYRWLEHWPLSVTLMYLGLTKDQYYYRCDKALDFVYHYVNGERDCL